MHHALLHIPYEQLERDLVPFDRDSSWTHVLSPLKLKSSHGTINDWPLNVVIKCCHVLILAGFERNSSKVNDFSSFVIRHVS